MDFVLTWALATPFPDHRQQSCLPEMAVLTHEPTSPGKHSRSCAPQRWYHCRDGHTAAASIRSGRAASCQQTTAQHPEPPPAIPSLSTSSQAGTRLSSGLQGSHRDCVYFFKYSAQLCLGCHRSAGILHAVAQRHTDIPPAAGVPHHLPHATPTCVPIQTHLRARTDGSVTKTNPIRLCMLLVFWNQTTYDFHFWWKRYVIQKRNQIILRQKNYSSVCIRKNILCLWWKYCSLQNQTNKQPLGCFLIVRWPRTVSC